MLLHCRCVYRVHTCGIVVWWVCARMHAHVGAHVTEVDCGWLGRALQVACGPTAKVLPYRAQERIDEVHRVLNRSGLPFGSKADSPQKLETAYPFQQVAV